MTVYQKNPIRRFDLRIEGFGTYTDVSYAAYSLQHAREQYEQQHPSYAPFNWRGAVCYLAGEQPAEERT